MRTDLDVAVVGAGLAGLTAADLLHRAGRSVQVFDAADRVGGRLASRRLDSFVIDEGAGMLSSRGCPATWRLIRRYRLDTDAMIPPIRAGVAAWLGDRARTGMGDPFSLTAGGLSTGGRMALLRLLSDLSRADHAGTGSVLDLGGTYGTELVDKLLQPLTALRYGGRAEHTAAAPLLADLAAVGAPRRWRTCADGMDALPRQVAAGLPVRRGTPVRQVTTLAGGARIDLDGATLTARHVVLAVPAPVALTLHPGMPGDERDYVRACHYAPMLRLSCLLNAPLQVPARKRVHLLAVPSFQSAAISGLTVDHARHPGRVPAGRGLIGVVAAPEIVPALLGTPDAEVSALLLAAAGEILPELPAATTGMVVSRFRYGMPDPGPEALDARAAFLARPLRPVDYAGDWMALRPGIEGAARSGEVAAGRVQERSERRTEEVEGSATR